MEKKKKIIVLKSIAAALLCCCMFAAIAAPAAAALAAQAASQTADGTGSGLETLFNVGDAYVGIINGSGQKVYNIKYLTSATLQVKSGNTIYAGPFYDDQEMYLTLYRDGKYYMSVSKASLLKKVRGLPDGGWIAIYTVPSAVTGVAVCCRAIAYKVMLITVDEPFDVAGYNAWVDAKGLREYTDFIEAPKNQFASKSVVVCGDSVGQGWPERNYEGAERGGVTPRSTPPSFAGRVCNLLGFAKYLNAARSGATFSTKMANNNISDQIKTYAGKYDYVLIEGGVVDTGGYASKLVPLGYISESYELNSFAPVETLLGGLERALYYATTNVKAGTVLAVIMPYRCPCSRTFVGDYLRTYQYYYYVCEKWGVPLIDLWHNDAVNEVIDYCPNANGNWFHDNIHCTSLGYSVCSLEVAREVYAMKPYDKADRHMPELPERITKDGWQEPDPGKPPVQIQFEGNLYNSQTARTGTPLAEALGRYVKTDAYVTSDYIPVKPGDAVYIGPVSPYEEVQLVWANANKVLSKQTVTSLENDHICGVLNTDRMILRYTVPEGMAYVRVTFSNEVSPVITVNRPFDREWYVDALARALKGEPVTAPEEYLPGTEPWNLPEETEPEQTEPEVPETEEPETDAVTEPAEKKKGCRQSAAILPAVAVLAAAHVLTVPAVRKKKTVQKKKGVR
jgi:lysophospholipase L1-like esterase